MICRPDDLGRVVQMADERLELPLFAPAALEPGVDQLLKRKPLILRKSSYLQNRIQLNSQDGQACSSPTHLFG